MSPAILLEQALRNLTTLAVTNAFLIVLLVVFFLAIWMKISGRRSQLVQYAPNLLTSIGILGTFVGIVIGLLDFDATDVEASISPLLDGLKTAFITSLAGMSLAIIFKIADSLGLINGPAAQQAVKEDVTPGQVLASLQRQEKTLITLSKAITSEEDTSLVGQIKMLRADQSEHARSLKEGFQQDRKQFDEFQKNLWSQLSEFAEMMSKSATEQVIEALRQVIKDFNQNLTEQFGENFAELNQAVGKLVTWQDNYQHQLEAMSHQYEQGVQAISATQQMIADIQQDTAKIPETMESLTKLLEALDYQIMESERHLAAFKDMRDQAVKAVPQIQQHIEQLIEELDEAVSQSAKSLGTSAEKMEKSLSSALDSFQNKATSANMGLQRAAEAVSTSAEQTQKHLDSMMEELQTSANQFGNTLGAANKRLHEQIGQVHQEATNAIERMRKRVDATLEEVGKHHSNAAAQMTQNLAEELKTMGQRTRESVNAQLSSMDEAMKKELASVMTEMGNALDQIAGQFTKDYKQLTQQMQQIVNEARSTR